MNLPQPTPTLASLIKQATATTTNNIFLLALAYCLVLTPQLSAQTTESLAVKIIAEDAPNWMTTLAKADHFQEPENSTPTATQPYSNANLNRTHVPGTIYHQPAGSLSGKTIFAMAGHGWTYQSDRMNYHTQRGLSHGMVEDLGNADQMHIFAHLLFNSGATVVPFRPIDHQPNERIIDNTMPQVEFFGEWRQGVSNRYFGSPSDQIPYRVADANLQETAVARYRPYIPESGYYPVYVWAKDGTDRSNQLYRIIHSGGQADINVNWRRVGKTWVWLGTYYFNEGDDGYVEISNRVIDPYEAFNGNVIIADAVRFGNGYGDVPRPGGISGYPREDEGDCYWIEQALGVNADRRIFDAGSDGNSTVSSPPKAAAHTNRETEGSFLDRLLISFHSNASRGTARGAIALFNARASQRPSYQEILAEIIGEEINLQMSAEEPPADDQWSDRERNTYSGINFGELRRDYIQNEMCATIVETAFHDNAEDVRFLLDPMSRIQMAQATLRGILHWYAEIAYPNSAYILPPARPVAVAATVNENRITVKWKLDSAEEYDGGPATEVRIYRSPNGHGFDGGISVDATEDDFTIDPLTSAGVTFLRVTAMNTAGESLPSQTIAVGLGNSSEDNPKTLHLAVNTILDSTTNIPYDLDRQPGGPYGNSAQTERVRALYTMQEPSGAAEALALAALGQEFDGADTSAYNSGLVDRKDYRRIFLTAEYQNPDSPLLSEDTENYLRSFLSRNGKLYISGSGIAENLASHGSRHKIFLSDILGITGQSTARAGAVLSSMDDRFFSTTGSLKLSENSRQWVGKNTILPARLKMRKGRTIGLLQYADGKNQDAAAAVLTRPSYSEGEIFFFGFPMSLIQDNSMRNNLMQALLKQM